MDKDTNFTDFTEEGEYRTIYWRDNTEGELKSAHGVVSYLRPHGIILRESNGYETAVLRSECEGIY